MAYPGFGKGVSSNAWSNADTATDDEGSAVRLRLDIVTVGVLFWVIIAITIQNVGVVLYIYIVSLLSLSIIFLRGGFLGKLKHGCISH